ncbi:hypothetical protein [Mycobacterium sp.]|uniref:hypothetical protein n=1 Tax=Mycobacterium sp. TaxID=1785 RepID=UPI003D0D02AB
MTQRVTHKIVGPRRHGVVQFGFALHAALQLQRCSSELLWFPSVTDLISDPGSESGLVHTHFTDRLFGSTPAAAASAFSVLARTVRANGSMLSVTLHDLPQSSDGAHYNSRIQAYRRVCSLCDYIAVSSEHERELMQENGIGIPGVSVIPLPIDPPKRCAVPLSHLPRTLGVFGFIYPGKGYEEIIAATKGLPADLQVLAIGASSPGHEGLVFDLRRAAAELNTPFRVTGYVAGEELLPVLRGVTVPVAAHRHISASGSLNTWLSAGRRPLVPHTRYAAEFERRNPGSLNVFADNLAGLCTAIRRALRDSASTWLPADVPLHPSPSEAAAAYAELFG